MGESKQKVFRREYDFKILFGIHVIINKKKQKKKTKVILQLLSSIIDEI